MGGGAWRAQDWNNYARSNIYGKGSAYAIYQSRHMKPEYDPRGIRFRESCDSDEHPDSTPIIIGLDVTGSMGSLATSTAEKLGTLVGEIYDRKPVTDPQLLFAFIGDAAWGGVGDQAPLQVTQFESDIRIAKQLTELWFENGGGGNGFESYPLAWWFAARHTKIDSFDKRGKKGYLFTMGDDCYPDALTKRELARVFGDNVPEDVAVEEVLQMACRKYEVFHLMMEQGGSRRNIHPRKWVGLLGERAIRVTDHTKIPEIIVSILEAMSGKAADDVVATWDKSTAVAVQAALSGLSRAPAAGGIVRF